METNLTFTEIRGLLSYGLNETIQIENVNLAGRGYIENGNGCYYQVEEESRVQTQSELRHHLGLESFESSKRFCR
ncbi:hypothetical protein [Oceanobacillus rekensis]|uniref:hypothetical protein n=1 Tax=Oceanobacillus rekensis TaxID=937927 RepID=UPI001592E77C|nr:hypothetical protein [Oceanobacillus rekensis]